MCETASCLLFGETITTLEQFAQHPHLRAQTQKAKGFLALAKQSLTPRPYKIIIDENDVEKFDHNFINKNNYYGDSSQLFVRPCPKRPRHGFVESRPVPRDIDAKEAIRQIFLEARAADPEAELIISPVINASHNVLFTPTRFSVGRGHDGATAGRGSITLPLSVPPTGIDTDLILRSGVDILEHDPYIETVIQNLKDAGGVDCPNMVYITQLRAGTKLPATIGRDYIPAKIRVDAIIEASGDLIEWEKQTQQITPGTVVVHIGGSLISHYGVHCMENKVPVLTSHIPTIGEVLYPTPTLPDRDPYMILKGLAMGAVGIPINTRGYQKCNPGEISPDLACLVLMTSLHNAAAMTGEDSFWIGVAAALMMRVGMSASHGEARHEKRKDLSREFVYDLAMNKFFDARALLGHVQYRFKTYSWPSGFGGKKWAECTESIMELDRAIRTFINDPTLNTISPIVNQLNVAVNKAHNGGWWLNKFIEQSAFTRASQQDLRTLALAGMGYLEIAEAARTFDPTPIIEEWKAAPEIEEKYSKWLYHEEEEEEETPKKHKSTKYTMQYTEPMPGCGDPDCTECHEPKLTNLTGTVKIPDGLIPIAAQCKINEDTAHIQVQYGGLGGYFSFDHPVTQHKGKSEYEHYNPSFSGSGKPYVQLDAYTNNLHSNASSMLKINIKASEIITLLNAKVPNEQQEEN